jgi:hypothetical protein
MVRVRVKETPAQAMDDAVGVLREAHGRPLSMREFIDAMEARGVTVSAAQDALRLLEGRGSLSFSKVGNLTAFDDSHAR